MPRETQSAPQAPRKAPEERTKVEKAEHHPRDAGWRTAESQQFEETPDEIIVDDPAAAIDDRRLHADKRKKNKTEAKPRERRPKNEKE